MTHSTGETAEPPPAADWSGQPTRGAASPRTKTSPELDLVARAGDLVSLQEIASAEALLQEVFESPTSDPEALVRAHALASWAKVQSGTNEAGMAHASKALCIAGISQDPFLLSYARVALARVRYHIGEFEQALADIEAAWPAVREGVDAASRFHCQNLFATILGSISRPQEAISWFERAVETARGAGLQDLEAGARANAAACMLTIGCSLASSGDRPAAEAAWREHLRLSGALESLPGMRISRRAMMMLRVNRAGAHALLGERELAEEEFRAAQSLLGDTDAARIEPYVAFDRAQLLRQLGDLDNARIAVDRAIAACEAQGLLPMLRSSYHLASAIAEAQGAAADSLAYHKRFHEAHSQLAAERLAVLAKVTETQLLVEAEFREGCRGELRLWEGLAVYVGTVSPGAQLPSHLVQWVVALSSGQPVPALLHGGVRHASLLLDGGEAWGVESSASIELVRVMVEPCTRLGQALRVVAARKHRPQAAELRQLAEAARSAHRSGSADALIRALALYAGYQGVIDEACRPWAGDTRVRRLLGAVAGTDLRDAPTDVAHERLGLDVGVTSATLMKLFQAQAGIPLRSFRRWQRIVNALQLMSARPSLTEVSHAAGFSSLSHFSRAFLACVGVTPSEFSVRVGISLGAK